MAKTGVVALAGATGHVYQSVWILPRSLGGFQRGSGFDQFKRSFGLSCERLANCFFRSGHRPKRKASSQRMNEHTRAKVFFVLPFDFGHGPALQTPSAIHRRQPTNNVTKHTEHAADNTGTIKLHAIRKSSVDKNRSFVLIVSPRMNNFRSTCVARLIKVRDTRFLTLSRTGL